MASSSGNFTMPFKDSERIQHHYDYFLERVFNPGDLITTLFSKGVLDLDRKTRILNTETGRPRVEKLLDILMTECGDCYQIFLKALRERGFGPIADKLGEQSPAHIRVALIGKTGVGKSHLGNLLLHRDCFKCSNSLHSCTSVCSNGERALDEDTNLIIVDTPGLFDTRDNNTETVKKFLSIFKFTGIHIFLMVVKIDVRFTEEDENALRSLCDVFGEDINDHLIVIMNNQSQGIKSKENLLPELPTSLKDILDRCKYRCLVVNYVTDVTVDGNEEIEAIINTIQSTVTGNKGRSYTHQMYKEAEKAYTETFEKQTYQFFDGVRR
ncbi:GTPase IMAP family member 4 [Patella vulgata]|uniref:GTPase IMAP family member 4 n=1 Tax=Patella vulgata TaxID=6465 RepID=UPI00217FC427|nr:GTPase IMAP family member 4 [Patella vulgata]